MKISVFRLGGHSEFKVLSYRDRRILASFPPDNIEKVDRGIRYVRLHRPHR